MDRIDRMRLFVRVAERSSFSAVAREAGLPQPTVSRAVRRLEEEIGAQLLARTTRSVALTPQGERYLERARVALEALDQAKDAVRDDQSAPVGTLRVTAPVAFGQHRVAPVLMAWTTAWIGARVELALTDRFVDLVAEGFDVAVRIGDLAPSTLKARRIGREPLRAVASPAFAARHPITHPADLASVPVVGFASLQKPWASAWRRGEEAVSITVDGPFQANHLPTVRDAVLRGLGASVLPDWLVADDLAQGRLVSLLPDWSPGAWPVHALLPPGRHPPRRSRLFVDRLRAALVPSGSAV